MVSSRFFVFFWGFLLFLAQFQSGYSLFLGYKKEALKHKLLKVKEALLSEPDEHHYGEEVHHWHYNPVYTHRESKWSSHSNSWPSYSGGWGHY